MHVPLPPLPLSCPLPPDASSGQSSTGKPVHMDCTVSRANHYNNYVYELQAWSEFIWQSNYLHGMVFQYYIADEFNCRHPKTTNELRTARFSLSLIVSTVNNISPLGFSIVNQCANMHKRVWHGTAAKLSTVGRGLCRILRGHYSFSLSSFSNLQRADWIPEKLSWYDRIPVYSRSNFCAISLPRLINFLYFQAQTYLRSVDIF